MSSERGARGRGDRGRGGRGGRRGGRRGRRGRRGAEEKTQWKPVTKLGRLVQNGRIKSLEEIYLFSLPIKEYQIVDTFLPDLKDEVMKVMPVQKQTRAGQRTRFKAFVCVGDNDCHLGLGVKCAKEVATAIRGAIISAKLALVPIRKGYWGSRYGKPHTVPFKVTGKCGSVSVRLIPAPRGTGIVAAMASKKILTFAGFEDVYSSSTGTTRTMGNFMKATYMACLKTYAFLTPDLWPDTSKDVRQIPYQEFSEELAKTKTADKIVADKVVDDEVTKPQVVPQGQQPVQPVGVAPQQPLVPQQPVYDPQQQAAMAPQPVYQTPQVDPAYMPQQPAQ